MRTRVRDELRKFFLENPGEFLTVKDIANRFPNRHIQTIRSEIYRLRKEQFLDGAYMVFINPEWKVKHDHTEFR